MVKVLKPGLTISALKTPIANFFQLYVHVLQLALFVLLVQCVHNLHLYKLCSMKDSIT